MASDEQKTRGLPLEALVDVLVEANLSGVGAGFDMVADQLEMLRTVQVEGMPRETAIVILSVLSFCLEAVSRLKDTYRDVVSEEVREKMLEKARSMLPSPEGEEKADE